MTDPAYWDAIQYLQSQENLGPDRCALKPPAPTCIAKALRQTLSFSTYSNEDIDFMAQAVWDALLAEGELLWQDGDMLLCDPKPGDEDVQSKTEQQVLVVPVGRDPQTPHADA